MLVSWRHRKRTQPVKPSLGWLIVEASSAAGSGESMWSEGRESSPGSDRGDKTGDHRLQFIHPDAPDSRDHEHADRDEQRTAGDVDRADVPAHERQRAGDPAEP